MNRWLSRAISSNPCSRASATIPAAFATLAMPLVQRRKRATTQERGIHVRDRVLPLAAKGIQETNLRESAGPQRYASGIAAYPGIRGSLDSTRRTILLPLLSPSISPSIDCGPPTQEQLLRLPSAATITLRANSGKFAP